MSNQFIKSRLSDFEYSDFKIDIPIEKSIIPKLKLEFDKKNLTEDLVNYYLWADSKLFNLAFINKYTSTSFLSCSIDKILSDILKDDTRIKEIMRLVKALNFPLSDKYNNNNKTIGKQILEFFNNNMAYLIIIYLAAVRVRI